MLPFTSVIVPCRNEAASLGRCLDSILASRYPAERMEVIVADGGSEDTSRAVLARYVRRDGRVRAIDNPARITPAALNRAIDAARGDYILRVDGHSTISPGYLQAAVEYLERSDAWAAGGVMRTVTEGGGVFAAAIRVVLSHPFGVGNSGFRTVTGGQPRPADALFNACWRRDVFSRLGPFNERLKRSQDIEFSSRIRRAGGRQMLLPSIESRYFIQGGLAAFVRQSWTNGVWAVLPASYLGRLPLRWRHLAPFAFVAAMTGSAAAALFAPSGAWIAAALAGLYGAANLAASIEAARSERDPSLAFAAAIVFASLHLAYGAGSLWGALRVAAGRNTG